MSRPRSRPRRSLLEFERMSEPLLPMARFRARLLRGFVFGATLIGGSLLIGVCGYHWLARLGWVDALLNASMILAGMGPVDTLTTRASKLFASAYALFSGVMFLTSVGVLLSPLAHRALHRFHLEADEGRDA